MLNKLSSKAVKKETSKLDSQYYGGFGGDNNSYDTYNFEHPSLDDIMKFVTADKEDILSEPQKMMKMITHFCQCKECKEIKDSMIQMESELELALMIAK